MIPWEIPKDVGMRKKFLSLEWLSVRACIWRLTFRKWRPKSGKITHLGSVRRAVHRSL